MGMEIYTGIRFSVLMRQSEREKDSEKQRELGKNSEIAGCGIELVDVPYSSLSSLLSRLFSTCEVSQDSRRCSSIHDSGLLIVVT